MSQNTYAPKTWTRPQAQPLGRIRNVAGAKGGSTVNGTHSDRT